MYTYLVGMCTYIYKYITSSVGMCTYIYKYITSLKFILHFFFSSGSEVRQLVGHAGPVYCTAFNPDNSLLLSSSEDGTGKAAV